MNRRSLLQLLGLGAAAPAAAALGQVSAASESLAGAAGVAGVLKSTGESALAGPTSCRSSRQKASSGPSLAELARGVFPLADAPAMWNDVLKIGLDPDLEVNRSLSLCAKAREQRRRNVVRAKADVTFSDTCTACAPVATVTAARITVWFRWSTTPSPDEVRLKRSERRISKLSPRPTRPGRAHQIGESS